MFLKDHCTAPRADTEYAVPFTWLLLLVYASFHLMDRLRSLRYFIASAEEGSFSAAARRLAITIPAVAKLVSSLERDLGVELFERSTHGLTLTAAGEHYLETCKPHVDMLARLDEQMRGSGIQARGTVVVGIQHVAAHELLGPALPRFHARHPDIQLDFREATQMRDVGAPGIDVYLSLAWPKTIDIIHRPLARARFQVCAAPAYWARWGTPREPRELQRHQCILIRTQTGTVMDVWSFTRDEVREDVTVTGWFVCANSMRDVAIRLAIAGQGVIRILDWTNRAEFASGTLVPVLAHWQCLDAPPMVLSYRPSVRRVVRVRAFIDFVQEVFRDVEVPPEELLGKPPRWAGSTITRASLLSRRRRST